MRNSKLGLSYRDFRKGGNPGTGYGTLHSQVVGISYTGEGVQLIQVYEVLLVALGDGIVSVHKKALPRVNAFQVPGFRCIIQTSQ